MHISQLEYIVDIADTQSISNTATRFFMTQQAVSSSIRQLENELGYTLLIRSKKGVIFTDEGKIFLEYATGALENFAKLKDNLAAFKPLPEQIPARIIYIFSTSIVGKIISSRLFSIIKKNLEQISIRFFFNEYKSYNLIEKIMNKECDICLITLNEDDFYKQAHVLNQNGVKAEVLLNDHVVYCFSSKSVYSGTDFTIKQDNNSCLKDHIIMCLSEKEEFWGHFYLNYQTCIMRIDDIWTVREILRNNHNLFAFMPNLLYTHYFQNTKYMSSKVIEEVPLVHAILYRDIEYSGINQLVEIIKGEVQKLT